MYAKILAAVLLLGGLPLLATCGSASDEEVADAGPWTFRGNLSRTGEYRKTQPINHPIVLWQFELGGIDEDSHPAVVDGVVYVESNVGYAYAIDATHGFKLWEFNSGSRYPSSPTVRDGSVYIETNSTGGGEDGIFGLDAATGKPDWFVLTEVADGSPPTLYDGTVYVAADSYIYAVAAQTGELLWRTDTNAHVAGATAVAAENLFVTSGSEIKALSRATGEVLWTSKTEKNVGSSPSVANGLLYAYGSNGEILALDAQDGALRWQFDTDSGQILGPPPAVANGIVYGGRPLVALDSESGKLLWELDRGNRAPSIVGDEIYITDHSEVCAAEADTGKVRWCVDSTSEEIETAPVYAEGKLFVVSEDGFLYAIGDPEQ